MSQLPPHTAHTPLLHRVAEQHRAPVTFMLNGEPATALVGDTVLTAILTHTAQLRRHEFGQDARAGFCLMGACQDCWVRGAGGTRLRACSTFITPGLTVYTDQEAP